MTAKEKIVLPATTVFLCLCRHAGLSSIFFKNDSRQAGMTPEDGFPTRGACPGLSGACVNDCYLLKTDFETVSREPSGRGSEACPES
jgi:hypothetical protein